MKLAVLSESPADDAAVGILVEAILGRPVELTPAQTIRRRSGFSSIPVILPVVLRELYYNTDADALVVVVDSNSSPVHTAKHEQAASMSAGCRRCDINALIQREFASMRPAVGRSPLCTAVGLACPAIEAWYLCGRDPRAFESAWLRQMQAGTQARSAILRLKAAVYGTDRPSLSQELEVATCEARRLAANLDLLEQAFPGGFGAFAGDVRGWRPG